MDTSPSPSPNPDRRSSEPSVVRLLLAMLVFVSGMFAGAAAGAGLLLYVPPFGLLFETSAGWVIAFLLVCVSLGGVPGVILFRRAWPKE